MENVQRLFPCRAMNWRIHICSNRSTAQAYGVGENPLNGKGMPLTGNAEGEEIVYSYVKT